MVLIGFVYFLLVLKEFSKKTKKRLNLNRIVVLIYIIVFCFSLFAGIAVFKNNKPLAIIPKLPNGTIGLRSYGCKAIFKKIEISFLDSNNIWQMIPPQVTNDSNNWKRAFKIYNDSINWKHVGDTISSCRYSNPNKTTLAITLNNSGVKFNTSNLDVAKYFKGAQYFKVNTIITVTSSYDKFSDIQICMNVTIKSDNKESEELYLGLSLPVKDVYNAKFWIPALEWISGNEYGDPVSKLTKNGINDYLTCGTDYNFIGVSFYNSARLLIKNTNGPSIICESKFESSK
jgi:hypothetical protein